MSNEHVRLRAGAVATVAASLVVAASCGKTSATTQAPAATAHASPVAASPPRGEPASASAPPAQEREELYPDWDSVPPQADLDGDGALDRIAFRCTSSAIEVEVGEARWKGFVQISELVGCAAAVVAIGAASPTPVLIVYADEHEEVGPDSHAVLRYAGHRLELLWSGEAKLSVWSDGALSAQTQSCDEDVKVLRTTVEWLRWSGAGFDEETEVGEVAIEEGDCAEP